MVIYKCDICNKELPALEIRAIVIQRNYLDNVRIEVCTEHYEKLCQMFDSCIQMLKREQM